MSAVWNWCNLVRKEWRESREVIIAGIVAFWICPTMLELFCLALNGGHDTFPIGWWALIAGGWLYAIIAGANMVCRDWGRAEEHFLLAQPVSPRAVVWAKLVVGAVLVVGLIAIVTAWEIALTRRGVFAGDSEINWHSPIPLVCVMAVSYMLAFTAAVMSRQMLASTVVACLVMLIWMVAPLLSSAMTRFGVLIFWSGARGSWVGEWLIILSVCVVIICATTSLLYATRERVIRLGNKQLAWTVGLIVLALFSVAMTEVGSSLQVRDQAELFETSKFDLGSVRTVQRGDRFFVTCYDYSHEPGWVMATFRVTDNGRIEGLRRFLVPGILPRDPVHGELLRDEITGLAINENGQLVVTGIRLHVVRDQRGNLWIRGPGEFENLWRATLSWPEGGRLEVASRAELALPTNEHLRYVASEFGSNIGSLRYGYLTASVSEGGLPNKLYVFDWQDGPNPSPRLEIPLPQDTSSVRVWGGKLRIRIQSTNPRNQDREATFDFDQPETLLDKRNRSFHSPTYNLQDVEFFRPGGYYVQVAERGELAYVSDLLGLRVARHAGRGHWEIVGETRAAPLAMLFRLVPQPKILDDSLLVESTERGIIAYDVLDPSKPKRVGFFNAIVPRWPGGNPVLATKRHLVVCEYNMITILDRPTNAKAESQ